MKSNFFTKFMAVAVIALLSLSTISFAGDLKSGGDANGRFSVGLELALPSGTFGDQAGTGFGASVRYEMPMGSNLALMGTIGYLTFGGKTVDFGPGGSFKYTESMIPIQVGAKYYFMEQQSGFYAALQLGITSFSVKSDITYPTGSGLPNISVSASTTDLSYAPGIGYHLANIDLQASYQIVSTTGGSSSYIGIRAAYVFGSK
jgi:hypothetical protein